MEAERGYLCLVLHAHLPFVRHPEFDRFFEEDWLFEAIIETYLPLLEVFENLVEMKAHFRVTMSMSPTLTAMLADPVLQSRFVKHIDRLIDLSEKEVERTRWIQDFHPLAKQYHQTYLRRRADFVDRYHCRLIPAFRALQDAGVLEILTCGATHGFLPLMLQNRNLWRGQIWTASKDYERHFGRPPRGIWLPECGYDVGVDEILRDVGIEYTFLDTHGILHAHPRPKYGVYAPVVTPAGLSLAGRDQESSQEVWSSMVGYPGDPSYREFYRDVGWDLDYEYVKPYLHADGNRSALGIKYYRITGEQDLKEPYEFDRAMETAAQHAGDFLGKRTRQADDLYHRFGRPCLTVAPFDAELFGHWWSEGPQWLDFLLRKIHWDQSAIKTISMPEYIERFPDVQVVRPSMSSWGLNGFCEHWLDHSNDWVYPHLEVAGERMVELANRYAERDLVDDRLRRALDQTARELLLAQSSDWPFILKTGTMVEYATYRARFHIANVDRLYRDIQADTVDEDWLKALEKADCLFPDVDYTVYADREA